MPAPLAVPVPFLLHLPGSTVEDVAIFCVAVLVAVTVSAESQGLAATLLGDRQPGGGTRFQFNAFLHLDPIGTLCFFVAGFGWAKEVKINVANFRHPRVYLMLSRLAGPLGNFMMASIAASIYALLTNFGFEDKAFSSVVVVNLMMAVYGCICIYPLPGSSIVGAIFHGGEGFAKTVRYFCLVSPFLLLAWFIVARLLDRDVIGAVLHPIVRSIAHFLATGM
ncbi:MAG: site-2 protease family protein [Desulfoprunum sp.]|jgi:hypothetical protein|uniref:site-2 protease family protein n=1 Tax=Desulfoprunum sp. TaxID=2020866 RepID=UPI0026C91771